MISRRGFIIGALSSAFLPTTAYAGRLPPLHLQRITSNIWLHVSWIDYGTVIVPSSGLVVACGSELLLIDTPCSKDYTDTLLDRLHMPVSLLITTHAHADRIAGMQACLDRGIPALMKDIGREKSVSLGFGAPTEVWNGSSHDVTVDGRRIELFFPGGAHSFDNIVAYIPDTRLLFGGCMVRGAAATTPGGMEFSDVCGWSKSLYEIEKRFPDARILVPGHGEPGGAELLRHTARLVAPEFERRGCV